MFVHEQLAIGQVSIELGDVGLGIGDVRGAAEVVTMIEEDFLGVGGVCGDITITLAGHCQGLRACSIGWAGREHLLSC